MSGSLPADVILEPRLGPRTSKNRARTTVGSTQFVYFELRDRETNALLGGATGVAAFYWLPGTVGQDSEAQPLTLVEIEPGIWRGAVPVDLPGTYAVWASIEAPSVQTAEIVFDATSLGNIPVSTGTPSYQAVQAVAGAAGASAALAETRRVVPGVILDQANALLPGLLETAARPLVNAAANSAGNAAISEEVSAGAADIAMTKAGEAAGSATQAETARGEAREAVEAAAAEAIAAGAERAIAEAASTAASAAAAAALAGSTIYATVDLGLAAVAEGSSFNVAAAGDLKVIVYRKTGGLAVYVTQIASQASVDMIPARLIQTASGGFFFGYEDGIAVLYSADGNATWVYPGAYLDVADIPALRRRDGKSAFALLEDGFDINGALVSVEDDGSALIRNRDGTSKIRLLPAGGGVSVADVFRADRVTGNQITVGDSFNISQVVSTSSRFLLPVVDPEGVVIGGLQHDGTWPGEATGGGGTNPTNPTNPTGVTSDDLVRLDAYCASLAADFLGRRRMSSFAGLVYGHNLTAAIGQSLSLGVMSGALISALARLGIYMVGDSVNAIGDASATWQPVGGAAVLKRLLVTALQSSTRGETISAAALDYLRRCWLRSAHLLEDDTLRHILMCAGVGGQGLANLVKGSTYYPKVTSALAAARTAVGAGVPINLLDYDFIHGESDSRGLTGGINDFAYYKGGVEQYYADLNADLCPNQELKPVMYVQQVSGGYLRDGNRMAIPMAQLAICDANPWAVFTGPYYRVPNHSSGHLYSNGSRWRGMNFGKAKENVLLRNEAYRSFAPWFVLDRGTTMVIGANPRGAMQITAPWTTTSQSIPPYQMPVPPSLGFEVFDTAGSIGVNAVTFHGNLIVIEMSRARSSPETTLDVRYGGEAFGGNGFVCDSDGAVSSQRYVSAVSETGTEVIPELDGKPYPGENSLAHFHLTSRPF